MIDIRPETPADFAAVRECNELAFGQPAEAGLVDALRQAARPEHQNRGSARCWCERA